MATFKGLVCVAGEGLLAIAIYAVAFRIISPATAKDVLGAARGGLAGLRARLQGAGKEPV